MSPRSAYDEIAYPTRASVASHPDRLATIATLMGLRPAPVARCRTLELGCGNGGNLIAMAANLPEASFVGCDPAARPIEAGRQLVAKLQLANIALLQCDLRDVPAESGEFDYIIAHGVYSWVPPPVRDAMLELIARRLAPQGVAFVSYNLQNHAAGCITAMANLTSPALRLVWDSKQACNPNSLLQDLVSKARTILDKTPPFPPLIKALLAKRHKFPLWAVRPPLLPLNEQVLETVAAEFSSTVD